MDKAEFFDIIQNPESLLDKADPEWLQEMVKAYPYFQTAYLLMGQAFYKKGSPWFDQWLTTIAVHVNDRQQLFRLLENQKETPELEELDQLINQTATPYDVSSLFGDKESANDDTVTEPAKTADQSLIDNFLAQYNSGNYQGIGNQGKATENITPSSDENGISHPRESSPELSEEAAQAAEADGRLRKAIEIYEKLSLQRPEWFNYFVEKAEAIKYQ